MARVKLSAQFKPNSNNLLQRDLTMLKVARKSAPVSSIKPSSSNSSMSLSINRIKSVDLVEKNAIPRAAFQRFLKDICIEMKLQFRFQREALLAIQESAEDYLIKLFEDLLLAAQHAKRKTVMQKDMELVLKLRKTEFRE